MAKFDLTATVNTSLAGTTLAGEQGFTVGVLNGVGATGPQGVAGANGTDGLGWTGGSYNSGTGIVTFTSDDGLGFSTTDLRGTSYTNLDVDAHLNTSLASANEVLAWTGSDYNWVAQSSGPTVYRNTKVDVASLGGTSGTISWTHGQSTAPVLMWVELVCTTAISGAQVGDMRQIFPGDAAAQDLVTLYARGTSTIVLAYVDDIAFEQVARYDTGALQGQASNWEVGIAGLWL